MNLSRQDNFFTQLLFNRVISARQIAIFCIFSPFFLVKIEKKEALKQS